MAHEESYDYIVVGAGSAGCAVAARLAENGKFSVLLLEAGGDIKTRNMTIPILFTTNFKTEVDWDYHYAPNPYTNNRIDIMPRGKVLGGSSAINAMIYQRGHPENYNAWERAGNKGWSWQEVLPYFIKSECQVRGESAFHGIEGPLVVSDPLQPNPMSLAFLAACKELGYAANKDFNAGEQEGFGLYQLTIRKGERCSAANAFLESLAKKKKNLTIKPNALVTKLLIEADTCVGVTYRADKKMHWAHCKKEVIVSAGTFNSPQLLMLSGLGPKENLTECGIAVLKDMPGVGQNLHDHASAILSYTCKQPVSLVDVVTEESIAQYEKTHQGVLTSNIGEAGGFIRLKETIPELQYHFHPLFFGDHGFNMPQGHGISLVVSVTSPKSRGYLKLVSSDPTVQPDINGNLFSASEDVKTVIEGLKIGRRLLRANALVEFLDQEYLPGDAVQTDDDFEAFVRQYGTHIYHPVGTCKMGREQDAVVNERLQVHGIKALRIADASIMPSIVNANTNAPSIMIGEKCADMILRGL